MNNTIIVSNENKSITKSLKDKGYNLIYSEDISTLIPYERKHADIQCLKIYDTYFVSKSCKRLISELKALDKKVITTEKDIKKVYPNNVLLNALFIDNKLYCKKNALDNSVKAYCAENNIEVINVNQGYAKCSTAVFENCFITADIGIYEKLNENGVEGLLIESGDIILTKYKNGIIIEEFLNNKDIKIEYLDNGKLIDIGGFIVL